MSAPQIPSGMRATVAWTAAGLGTMGLFTAFAAHADVGAITTAWSGMFIRLAHQADLELDKDDALKIAAGVLVGIGGLAAGVKLANTWLAYTGVGTLPAMVCNAGTNGAVTYVIGCSAARVFISSDRGTSVQEMVKAIVRIVFQHGHHA
jgi:Domain of unknown function (DUF697)